MRHSSSSKANRLSASHEITCLLWHPNVRNLVHRNQSPVPVLRRMNAVHIPPMFLHKDPFWNYSPTYTSVMLTVSMIFKPNIVRNSHFSHTCQMSRPCQPPRCHNPVIRDEYKYVRHYMVFSKLLSIPRTYTQIFSSEPPSSGQVKNEPSYTSTPPTYLQGVDLTYFLPYPQTQYRLSWHLTF